MHRITQTKGKSYWPIQFAVALERLKHDITDRNCKKNAISGCIVSTTQSFELSSKRLLLNHYMRNFTHGGTTILPAPICLNLFFNGDTVARSSRLIFQLIKTCLVQLSLAQLNVQFSLIFGSACCRVPLQAITGDSCSSVRNKLLNNRYGAQFQLINCDKTEPTKQSQITGRTRRSRVDFLQTTLGRSIDIQQLAPSSLCFSRSDNQEQINAIVR